MTVSGNHHPEESNACRFLLICSFRVCSCHSSAHNSVKTSVSLRGRTRAVPAPSSALTARTSRLGLPWLSQVPVQLQPRCRPAVSHVPRPLLPRAPSGSRRLPRPLLPTCHRPRLPQRWRGAPLPAPPPLRTAVGVRRTAPGDVLSIPPEAVGLPRSAVGCPLGRSERSRGALPFLGAVAAGPEGI